MFTMRVFCIILLSSGLFYATESRHNDFFENAGPLVKTAAGSVVGKYVKYFDTEVAAFFGIPYAKPPLGERRFTKAEPAEPWEGIRLAQQESLACAQHSPLHLNFFPPANFSEDCLYLNVWAPKDRCSNSPKNLPVLVWIHGGGFTMGSADTNMYDCSKLVTHGEVIVVSMNYRLGPLGFLNIGNEEAPGNIGLMDQVLALRWVKENIESFGGDPGSITIFGESAGSWSVSLHLISPLSRNLFNRAIMQSGVMYSSYLTASAEEARHKANDLAVAVGCANDNSNLNNDPETVMKCLRAKDPITLCKKDQELRLNTFAYASAGNEFLPKQPIDAYESGEIAPVEVLIGAMRDEGTMFLPWWVPEFFSFQRKPMLSLDDAKKSIPLLFRQLPFHLHGKIFNFYFKNIAEEDNAAIVNAIQFALGDYLFNCPIMFLGEKLDNAYMYWMTHESLSSSPFPSWFGVHHAADLFYVFGKSIFPGISLTPRDEKFSNDIIRNWVTFARNGHPMSEKNKQQWPKFSLSEDTTYELNEGNYKTIPFPRQQQCKFWRPIIAPDTCSSESCSSI